MNTFGTLFRLTTFGESHGPALGAVIDGCPAGVPLSRERVQAALDRRRPGQSLLSTARSEPDQVEILSGIFEGRTLGTPIAALVRNQDARPQDYARREPRRGHADAVWTKRFGHSDPRGGGRSSGRETLSRVIGGAVAEALFDRDLPTLRLVGWVSQVGPLRAVQPGPSITRGDVDAHPVRCPDPEAAARMAELILEAKTAGDSYGGSIDLRVSGLPPGLGEPVFGKLKSTLASGLAGIGTVCGVTWGPADLEVALSEPGSRFFERSDFAGGIQGGMANGSDVHLRVYCKPPSTLGSMAREGRHDPCVLPRAVPVAEAMASLAVADAWLHFRALDHRP